MALRVADENKVAGVICFGYPFHAPRNLDRWRLKHLLTIQTPTLICQGEYDRFGNREEVEGKKLSKSITMKWLEDGDHNFEPSQSSGRTIEENMQDTIKSCNNFINGLDL
jgi:predicted alpha/beta-hydrolase family hydrolase